MKVPEANDSFLNVRLTGQVETSSVAGGARWFNRQENIMNIVFIFHETNVCLNRTNGHQIWHISD